ncbi:hypothetical protein [Qingshengfaniella alkalisoli]|uniref:Uncharacterized protein n=1 Tax=Qingshengfaniella alkalisoli TaxID=2599296 RepID=A0A5B8I704_9RHOB|nr:hypothetical protein [Qingshengfaniella alkalisoli]QDY69309.1 hypothetical protein FPZ52_06480 [Qingshengfaniella alkalisoli]
MTPTQIRMRKLEERDYSKLDVPEHLLHFVKMRDCLAYYSLQLRPFFNQEPWDLPVVVNGRTFGPNELETLQGRGMSSVEFYDLLTDIEAALIEAAVRRGIRLKKRGKLDDDPTTGTPSQRRRRPPGALGE